MIPRPYRRPSSDIAHGFEGSIIKTTDGLTITGIVLSDGDPVIIRCLGAQTQTITRFRIASLKPLEKSLMFSPAQLGLTAQSIAVIAHYLQAR